MQRLICLNLSRNSLTGNIIGDIGEMEMLECLDLSQNHLSGKIPTSFTQLNFLTFLNLSSNGLSGKIPTSTQLQSFNASVYAENDGLCGAPLASRPEDSLKYRGGQVHGYKKKGGIKEGLSHKVMKSLRTKLQTMFRRKKKGGRTIAYKYSPIMCL
ncbi:receptor-like protein EIX1 [Salvia miltiorrhiza]|uniref:receptor-like protein EIX1 n=1 Tax=Salvia miltiorrhiza TaxID=226208 RepID=UPI0025AB86B1|nr:receptor-like protein EIX1 [Salvia miltiorrhiza]